jgi:LCP family protein required for cell wall assembly
MPDTPSRVAPETAAGPPVDEPGKPIRRKRGLRIALLSVASVIVVLGAAVAGGFAYLNHVVGGIPRVPVSFTVLHTSASSGGMTVLLTGNQIGPTGADSPSGTSGESGLIMLLHLNANHQAGGAVSIPPQTEVNVPGHGQMQLWDTLKTGGPSLLVQTVQSVTGVPIDHYAALDFNHVASTINAIGGVSVTMPDQASSFGHVFHAGVNQLTGTTAVDYVRQPSLSETGRVLRQQSLLRAVLAKLYADDLLKHPVIMVRVLNSFKSMLTVDSNFSNSQIESLANQLGHLSPAAETFVTAPTETDGSAATQAAGPAATLAPESSQLWKAINRDSLAAFAQRYPATVTPAAPN